MLQDTSGDLSLGVDKARPSTGNKDGPGVVRKPGVNVVPPDAPMHDGGPGPHTRRQSTKLDTRGSSCFCM